MQEVTRTIAKYIIASRWADIPLPVRHKATLGLNEQQMAWALGIAATQSSGLREMFGSMCKSLHPGRAAQGGLTAALLAARNFTSSECVIEAETRLGACDVDALRP